jgi:hypothetical protein
MARIRQQHPQNYSTSGNISTEFENLIRYLNSAELGNNTVGELMSKLFDSDGIWDGPVEFRNDSAAGLQYRIGKYTLAEEGWVILATSAALRGADGRDIGEIGAPIFFNRVNTTATAAQVIFDYTFAATDELLVYLDGVLQREGTGNDYTKSSTGGSTSTGAVTMTPATALSTSNVVTIVTVRTTAITNYVRSDISIQSSHISANNQIGFVFDSSTVLHVYRNGILQTEGATNDYVTLPNINVVQFNAGQLSPPVAGSSVDTVSIITVENTANQDVAGLMLEQDFADPATGLISYAKLNVAANDIPQAKVNGLVTDLAATAKLTVSVTTPSAPSQGDLWMDTSSGSALPSLKFYDTSGTQWINTSPESSLPAFVIGDAYKIVRVNGTGTALEFNTQDLSSVIPITEKAAPNGVATLDSLGRMPFTQLPSVLSTQTLYLKPDLTALNAAVSVAGGSATTYSFVVSRFLLQKATVTSLGVRCTSGTASVTLTVDGVDNGAALAFDTVVPEYSQSYMTGSVSSVQIDASSSAGNSKSIGVNLTNLSSGSQLVNLEIFIAVSIVT